MLGLEPQFRRKAFDPVRDAVYQFTAKNVVADELPFLGILGTPLEAELIDFADIVKKPAKEHEIPGNRRAVIGAVVPREHVEDAAYTERMLDQAARIGMVHALG